MPERMVLFCPPANELPDAERLNERPEFIPALAPVRAEAALLMPRELVEKAWAPLPTAHGPWAVRPVVVAWRCP